MWAGTAETVSLIWGKREAKYFCARGWTGFRVQRNFCLSGKSIGESERFPLYVSSLFRGGVEIGSHKSDSRVNPGGCAGASAAAAVLFARAEQREVPQWRIN